MKMMLEGGNLLCPVCCTPFDQSKHRKLIDSCGHEICYMCLNSDHCPLCVYNTSESYRPRVKTNGHFTKYMQARHGNNSVRKPVHVCPPAPQSVMVSSPQLPRTRRTWRHPQWPGHLYSDNQTAFSDDELQSHSRCSSKQDLYMRLGLLLGDNMPSAIRKPRSLNHSSQDSYASISSLASSEPNTSPLSVLTDSSDVEPLPLAYHSRPKRDQRSNSVVSLMSTSTSTGHSSSSSPMGTMFQRHVPARTSDSFVQRAKRSITHGRISHISDESVHKLAELGRRNYFSEVINEKLKPLYFEVPQTEVDPLFVGRQWLFREIEQELSLESKGKKIIVITGAPGSGKTAIASQLVAHSCFRNLREEHIYHDVQSLDGSDYNMSNSGSSDSGVYQSVTALHQDTVHSLGNRIVAYHYCQSDNYLTCHVPEFVHSIAAHLCRAPQLVAYRELLVRDLRIQNFLSMPSCIADPSAAFIHGILEPLHNLKCHNRIPNITCLILIEGLHEAEFHRPDYGDTIATFLLRHIHLFPLWLKMILTIRSSFCDVVKPFSARYLSLDKLSGNENLQKDLTGYILYRINSSPTMRANITVNNSKLEGSSSYRFANHLAGLSKGCMLYLRLTLDLIEKGYLVVKSSSYRVLPVCLNEVYMLNCNLKFTTIKSFEKVKHILQICLATLYPLTLDELFQMVNAMYVSEPISWDDFMQRMETLTSGPFLVVRQDGTVMFAHPSMREWLVKREENENIRFLCETRTGHAAIAFHLSRCGKDLSSQDIFELGHHILKAHIYKSVDRQSLFPCLPRDLQAFWVNLGSNSIAMALGCFRNIYSPNVKVSRLLLLAGASPHHAVVSLGNAPILSLSACHGHTEMTGLLIEFGANINSTSDSGVGALALACQKGHLEIVRLLLERGAKINQVDNNGFCPTVHAASNGHLDIIVHLMQCDWPNDCDDGPTLAVAAQRALVAAAENGHANICEFLLDMSEVQVNGISDLTGHTALTAASFAGHTRVCEVLLLRGASVINTNDNGQSPLACAAAEGHWEVVEKLLLHNAPINQRDANARTPLMLAAMCGHPVLELLLSKGAPTDLCDKDGSTALCLACLKGHYQAAQCLLSHGANANHADANGRTPLDFAAYSGDSDIVQLLLDSGAVLEHVDATGMRPLDRAIAHKNTAAVIRFLNKGAKLGSQTWEMAEGNPRILYLLLTKLLEDATVLYKRLRLKDAAHRYQYALKKFPSDSSLFRDSQFQQLKYQLYLGLSQCKRKMKENQAAVDAAEQAIALNSKAFEGYYARARALEELGLHKSALKDIMEAFHLAPQNPEIRKVIMRLKEEISACDTSNLEAAADVENCVSAVQKPSSSVPEGMLQQLQSLSLDLSDLGHTKDRMQDSGCESNN